MEEEFGFSSAFSMASLYKLSTRYRCGITLKLTLGLGIILEITSLFQDMDEH